jgi:hypothetical protein
MTVLSYAGKGGRARATWLCRCDCGRENVALGERLRRGATTSCGCYKLDIFKDRITRHGMRKHPAYNTWRGMRERCGNPRNKTWLDYGGRGITVCERWRNSFEAFWEDMGPTWADGLSIDRIDANGNYEPLNCRWASRQQQSRNQRSNRLIETPWGVVSVAEAAERSGVSYKVICSRVKKGWPTDKIFDAVAMTN